MASLTSIISVIKVLKVFREKGGKVMVKRDRTTIQIDLELFKRIQGERRSFDETDNDILRRLLKLGPAIPPEGVDPSEGGLDLGSGVFLPNGTTLRRRYKGEAYIAPVERGQIMVKGRGFTSPSGAAVEITGSAVNGWRFWEVKRPQDADFQPLGMLRKGAFKGGDR
jgi:hypothetical protein